VIEHWNNVNDFIRFGKGGELATNQLDEQETSMLALHLVQICLVYINTLMIQRVLDGPDWSATSRLFFAKIEVKSDIDVTSTDDRGPRSLTGNSIR
jgi:hypothetical protein